MGSDCGIFIAECRASSVDEIRIQIQNYFQGRIAIVIRDLRFGFVLFTVLLRKLCVVVAGADNLVSQTQCHQLFTGVGIGADHALRYMGKGHFLIILCYQSKRKYGFCIILRCCFCLCLRLNLGFCCKYACRCHHHGSCQKHCK